jgi:hypothetical protein
MNPRITHAMDQLGAALRDTGVILGRYRAALIAEGVPPADAWELVIRLEERLLGPVVDEVERRAAEGPPRDW